MRKRWTMIILAVLSFAALGCGGDGAKGVNKDKDKPRPADKSASHPWPRSSDGAAVS